MHAKHFLRVAGFFSDDAHHQRLKIKHWRSLRGGDPCNCWRDDLHRRWCGQNNRRCLRCYNLHLNGCRLRGCRHWYRHGRGHERICLRRNTAVKQRTESSERRLRRFQERHVALRHRILIRGVRLGGLPLRLLEGMNPGKMRLGRDRWDMQWLRAMSGNGSRYSGLAHCFTNDHGCRQYPRRIGRR